MTLDAEKQIEVITKNFDAMLDESTNTNNIRQEMEIRQEGEFRREATLSTCKVPSTKMQKPFTKDEIGVAVKTLKSSNRPEQPW